MLACVCVCVCAGGSADRPAAGDDHGHQERLLLGLDRHTGRRTQTGLGELMGLAQNILPLNWSPHPSPLGMRAPINSQNLPIILLRISPEPNQLFLKTEPIILDNNFRLSLAENTFAG